MPHRAALVECCPRSRGVCAMRRGDTLRANIEGNAVNRQRMDTSRDSMNSGQRTILGLDIGGTKTACVEGACDGRIVQRVEMATHAEEPFAATFSEIVRNAKGIMDEAAREGRTIGAISVSVGGPLRIEEGLLLDPPHLPGWHNVPLKARLMEAFPGVPVFVEHDGNAGALAEFYFGVGRHRSDLRHLIFLTFGTGVGGGFIINGQIVRGASDTAGEIGHWRLAEDGPLGFGKRGSWESFASGTGMVELAAQMFPARWSSATPIRTLVEAMLADDSDALQVADEAGKWMGRGLALLIDALNPQVIVLGSLGVALGELILGPGAQGDCRRKRCRRPPPPANLRPLYWDRALAMWPR